MNQVRNFLAAVWVFGCGALAFAGGPLASTDLHFNGATHGAVVEGKLVFLKSDQDQGRLALMPVAAKVGEQCVIKVGNQFVAVDGEDGSFRLTETQKAATVWSMVILSQTFQVLGPD